MKNKLVVMVVTFLIMIALTPFIFGKLMNAKFNKMILKLQQQQGIEIKEVKDKSSYLLTDRVFEVTVPGSVLEQKEIKSIKFLTEVKFKNLPVTDVKFLNTLKSIVLKDNTSVPLVNDKIKIAVITPDFKVYRYKILDESIDLANTQSVFSWRDFNGIYDLKNKTFKNENGVIEFKDALNNLKIYNIKIFFQDLNNQKVHHTHFDVNFSNPKIDARIVNFNSDIKVKILDNKINLNSVADCNEISLNNIIKINNIKFNFEMNGIDKDIAYKFQTKTYTEDDIDKLLKEGFSGKFDLEVKNIFFMQNLGFLNIKSTFALKNGSLEKLNNNDISCLDMSMNIKTSPELMVLLSKFYPPLNQITEIKNNKAVIDIVVNKGNITVNGKSLESN